MSCIAVRVTKISMINNVFVFQICALSTYDVISSDFDIQKKIKNIKALKDMYIRWKDTSITCTCMPKHVLKDLIIYWNRKYSCDSTTKSSKNKTQRTVANLSKWFTSGKHTGKSSKYTLAIAYQLFWIQIHTYVRISSAHSLNTLSNHNNIENLLRRV